MYDGTCTLLYFLKYDIIGECNEGYDMFITVSEYAKRNGLSKSGVHYAIKKGYISVKKKGNKFLINDKTQYPNSEDKNILFFDGKYYELSYHPLYSVWRDMKQRCFNSKTKCYKDYGERGITVCPEWKHNALAFIKWGMENGYQKGLQLDRIDNNGIYEPNNCRWVTAKVNCNNRRNNVSKQEKERRKTEQKRSVLLRRKERHEKSVKKLEEERKIQLFKPFEKYRRNIYNTRMGFQFNLDYKNYKTAIMRCDFDLLESGAYDDLINDYMLKEYEKYYETRFA